MAGLRRGRRAGGVMDGWVTVLVAVVSGLSALGGAWVAAHVTTKAQRDLDRQAARRRNWEAKREAYLELLAALDAVESRAAGALVARRGTIPAELAERFTGAVAAAEFHASPEAWERAAPAVQATSAKANVIQSAGTASAGEQRAEAMELLDQLGARGAEGAERLRGELLAAFRDDLGLTGRS